MNKSQTQTLLTIFYIFIVTDPVLINGASARMLIIRVFLSVYLLSTYSFRRIVVMDLHILKYHKYS
jgi:hypothetical protein